MTWFRVDDNLAFHAKTVAAGNAAMGMWVRAGSWSSQQLTDGFVPAHMIPTLGNTAQARALVNSGLWLQEEGGYRFWQWGERNPSRVAVDSEREAARERMANRRRDKKGAFAESSPEHPPNNGERSGEHEENFARSSEKVRPPRPDPSLPVVPNGTTEKPRRGSKVPDIFPITPKMRAWADENDIRLDLERETAKWQDYHRGKGTLGKDWEAFWRNGMLKAAEWAAPPRRTSGLGVNFEQ